MSATMRMTVLVALVLLISACPNPPAGEDAGTARRDAGTTLGDGGNQTILDGGTTDGPVPDAGRDAGAVVECNVAPSSDPLIRATTHGQLQGERSGTTRAFKGIPFAAPPTGDNRFRPPQPPACWSGVRDATAYGDRCVQRGTGAFLFTGEEDCLFLNVWTPDGVDGGAQAGLPVMFFIHGGANILGSSNEDGDLGFNLYDGEKLAKAGNAVVVSTNYRLGPLGFLAHPALAAEDPHQSSGNYALLDLIAALQWVQSNIATFGGDPARVMIFGESAGALNTCMLVASPLASGLFGAAIMESGDCAAPPKATREAFGRQLALNVGCTASDGGVAACLRSLTPEALVEETPLAVDMFKVWDLPFGPNVDGWVLPDAPLAMFQRGEHNKVPFVVGSNAHETELFLPAVVNTCLDYDLTIRSLFPTIADAALQEYPCLGYLLARWAAVDLSTDMLFTCPARRILRALDQGQTQPVWRYHYRHARLLGPLALLRSFHASELPFIFGTHTLGGYIPTGGDDAVVDTLQSRWSALAHTHNPNVDGGVSWTEYVTAQDNTAVLEDPVSLSMGIASDHCDFWDSLVP